MLVGGPGTGKSAALSELIGGSSYDILVYYFCDAKSNLESLKSSNFLTYAILSLAGNPELRYQEALLTDLGAKSVEEAIGSLGARRAEGETVLEQFQVYVLDILRSSATPCADDNRRFVVLDSFDEGMLEENRADR
eukprot:5699447-Prorocentrum_lima.AAC.1